MDSTLRRAATGFASIAGHALPLLVVAFAVIANTALADVTTTIALKGDAALDGNGLLNNLEWTPVVNDEGQVLFVARYAFTSGGSSDNYAALLYEDGLSTQLVREGEAAPDGNGLFLDFGVPMLSNNGAAALYATFTDTAGGFSDDKGIVSITSGPNMVVREGDSANGDGTYLELNGSSLAPLAMNGLGQVAVQTRLTDTAGGLFTDGSIVVGDGVSLIEIAREGDLTPAGNGNYGYLSLPDINNVGTVAFRAHNFTNLNPLFIGSMAIVTQSGGVSTEIVRADAASPDGNGTFDFLNDNIALSSTGQVAFSSSFENTAGGLFVDAFAMVRGDSTSLDIIARAGDSAPDGNGVIGASFASFGAPQINGFGDVTFSTTYAGTAGASFDDNAILRGNVKPLESSLVEVVREGWSLPAGDGEFANIVPNIYMNEAGVVAFTAGLRTVDPPGDDLGIFLGDGIDLVKVVRVGDGLDGFTVEQIASQGFGITEGSLNRHGQVAFRAKLNKPGTVSEGNFLFTPDLHYRSLGNSLDPATDWDVGLNNSGEINVDAREHWTLGLIPSSVHNVIIDNGSRINGPATDTTVRHLTIVSPGVLGGGLIVKGGTHFTATEGILINAVGNAFTWLSASGLSEVSGDITVLSAPSPIPGFPWYGELLAGSGIFNGNILNGGTIRVTNAVFHGNIQNDGRTEITAAFPITPRFYGNFTNNGELILESLATAEFFGDYLGAGTIDNDGTIIFHGLGPGTSPANIEVAGTGTIELAATGVTTIELGGTERGSFHADPRAEYDSMTFVGGGDLELGGTLGVQLISPDGIAPVYEPGLGDSFMIFTAGQILGDFALPFDLPALAPGLQWLVNRDSQSLSLAVAAVPDGDFNGDGDFDCLDVDALVAEIAGQTNDPTFDLTGDQLVDLADRDAWLVAAGAVNLASGNPYLLGDANLDGVVDGQDFIAWNANKFTASSGWCSGDFNADGLTDGQDFIDWNANKFTSSDGVATVPEPGTGVLLVATWIGLAVVRRRWAR